MCLRGGATLAQHPQHGGAGVHHQADQAGRRGCLPHARPGGSGTVLALLPVEKADSPDAPLPCRTPQRWRGAVDWSQRPETADEF